MTKKILIVEDSPTLSDVLSDYLGSAGYTCHVIDNGSLVEDWVKANSPNMILLDVALPGKDGLALCKALREFSKVPIIMITGRAEEGDRLQGLNNGADDYICKPFRPREVVARVNAIFRRVEPNYGVDNEKLENDNFFLLDDKRQKLYVHGEEITLTSMQCNILSTLMSNEGVILSRDELMNRIYPDNRIVSHRTIDSHIRELRKNIATVLPDQDVIYAIYAAGYKYEAPIAQSV